MSDTTDSADAGFEKRREESKAKINEIDRDKVHDEPERQHFFNAVYEQAGGDAALVPWADLKEKDKLKQWLEQNSGINSSSSFKAIDVACGLGDNAEAIAKAGYQTTAFDLAGDAIKWAKKRFPQSSVSYHQADLFDLPSAWVGTFDLVHECYTLQALPPEMLEKSATAIASLVKPGGTLLVFTRTRKNGAEADGPPWPLEESATLIFERLGFSLVNEDRFANERNGRTIPHSFMEWKKTSGAI